MAYRKGELGKGSMDRNWPHQVALPACRVNGANYVTVRLFCNDEKLSLWACAATGSGAMAKSTSSSVSAKQEDADTFAQRFDREHMTPETRPPWIEKRKKV